MMRCDEIQAPLASAVFGVRPGCSYVLKFLGNYYAIDGRFGRIGYGRGAM